MSSLSCWTPASLCTLMREESVRSPVPSFSKRAERRYLSMIKGSCEKSGAAAWSFFEGSCADAGVGVDCCCAEAFDQKKIANSTATRQRFIQAPRIMSDEFSCVNRGRKGRAKNVLSN